MISHQPDYRSGDTSFRAEALELTDARWAGFVQTHPQATTFHLPVWGRLVAECYGFRSFALAVIDSAHHIVAGVPVVEVRQPFGRRKWVALPFTDYCPVLVDEPPSDSAEPFVSAPSVPSRSVPSRSVSGRSVSAESALGQAVLVQEARRAMADAGARRLQIRAEVAGADTAPVAVRHVLALSTDLADVFGGFHRSQVQRNIRRAEREGVTVRTGTEEADLTETFYHLHRLTRRRQGVPVQPRRFFALIWRRALAAGHGSVLIAEHGGVPVAAAVFLRHNATVIYKYGASDAAAWAVRPNHALFWQAIRTASSEGCTWFDWGRTDLDNAGLRAFKAAWGATEHPLGYSTIGLDGAAAATEHDLTGSAPARLAATVIQKSPAWVCSAVGEALYRYTA